MGYQRRVHGNHIILGLLGVRMIAIRLLVVVACLCAFAPSNIEAKKKMKRVEDVFCDGKKKFEVYLKAGKEYKFETATKPKKIPSVLSTTSWRMDARTWSYSM